MRLSCKTLEQLLKQEWNMNSRTSDIACDTHGTMQISCKTLEQLLKREWNPNVDGVVEMFTLQTV